MGQQQVSQGKHLGLLQVGVSWKGRPGVLFGQVNQRPDCLAQGITDFSGLVHGVKSQVGGYLVVAAAAVVQPLGRLTDELAQPPLDGHMDVLVLLMELELPLLKLRSDVLQPLQDSCQVLPSQ